MNAIGPKEPVEAHIQLTKQVSCGIIASRGFGRGSARKAPVKLGRIGRKFRTCFLSGGVIIITPETIVRQSPNIVSRNIAGEVILVPIAKSADELESIYTLNETASTVWDALDGQRTLADLAELVVAEYDVATDVALQDLVELMEQLQQIRAVEVVAP